MSDSALLVVAHEATRTGGPIVLRELLRRTAGRHPRGVAVRLLADGPLGDELRAFATISMTPTRPGTVLVNSALGAGVLAELPPDVPSLVYVHEEGDALASLDLISRDALVQRAHRVLAVSEQGRDDLVHLGVDPDRLGVLAPIVSVQPPEPAQVAEVRERLLEGAAGPLVLACGEAGWRKGADLFVQLAAHLGSRRGAHAAGPRLAWVGRRPRAFARVLDSDARATGAADRLRWHDEVDDTRAHLAAADLVVMTSREDPQPLVPLEAVLLGTPVVGFDVGGIARMAAHGAAATVAYPDTVALARLVDEVLDTPTRAGELVADGTRWVGERHDPDRIVACFLDELDRVRRGGGPTT